MAYYVSMRDLYFKYRHLSEKGGVMEVAMLTASADVAQIWARRSLAIMQRRIYGRYTPTRKEYQARTTKKLVRERRAAHRAGEAAGVEAKAWKRYGVLAASQGIAVTLNSVK